MAKRAYGSVAGVLFLGLAFPAALLAQAGPPASQPTYESLLERVKKEDPKVDFTALRMASVDRPAGKGGAEPSELRHKLFPALGEKNYDQALELAAKVLAGNYLDLDAHIVSALACEAKHDAAGARLHNYVAEGLARSILASGDGKAFDTAYVVISVDEEYTILRILGWHVKEQHLQSADGHHYDEMDVFNPKTRQDARVYFNVDLPFAHYR
jgi:hypothetical protein